MNTVAAIFIVISAAAAAFVAGWLASKARFNNEPVGPVVTREKHRKLLRTLRSRYQKRLRDKDELIQRHEAARDNTRGKITDMEQTLSIKVDHSAALETELAAQQETLSHLKETVAQRNHELETVAENRNTLDSQLDMQMSRTAAIENELALSQIEREELKARNQRLEAERKELTDTMNHQFDTAERQFNYTAIEDQRAELGELRETLANREHKIRELEIQVEDKQTRIAAQDARLHEWKHRMAPLAQQLRKHQNLLRQVAAKNQQLKNSSGQAAATPDPQTEVDTPKGACGA